MIPSPATAVDPYARREQMFPRLSEAQIARFARVGTEHAVRAGDIVFNQGDREVPFHIVLEGALAHAPPQHRADRLGAQRDPPARLHPAPHGPHRLGAS